MITYLIDFINNNQAIILLIVLACILLSLISKRIRKNISRVALTGLIPFSIAIMHRFGLGLNILYSILEKHFYFFTELIGKLQLVLIDKKDFLLLFTNVENEIGDVSFSFLKDLEANIIFVVADLYNLFNNSTVRIKKEINNIKEQIVIKTNLSKFSYCFRV